MTTTSDHATQLSGVRLWLLWGLWLLTAAGSAAYIVVALPLMLARSLNTFALAPIWIPWVITAARVWVAGAFLFVAALLAWQKPRNRAVMLISWLMLPVAATASGLTLLVQPPGWGWALLREVLYNGAYAATVTVFFIFPDGKITPRWGRYPLGVWLTLRAFDATDLFQPAWSRSIWLLTFFLGVGVYAHFWRRKHTASAVQRQQIRWVTYGMVVATLAAGTLFPISVSPTALAPVYAGDLFVSLMITLITMALFVALSLIPITIGVSALRYRLWDVDYVINRSLVYGALTVLLMGLFGASLWVISLLARGFQGGPALAVVVSAAAFGALFQPARHRLQRWVDRKFYGIEVDYRGAARQKQVAGGSRRIRFHEYQTLSLIGRGGMAEVYRAAHETLTEPVAIKILHPHLVNDPNVVRRFEREAALMRKLQHPNIVRVLDADVAEGAYFMVMAYLPGPNLRDLLAQRGALPLDTALRFLAEIASALDYLHSEHLVHRDIKPSNIVLDAHGSAVLTDFGIARVLDGATHLTGSGVIGTLDYMAPEQIRGLPTVDARADVYALGVVAFEMLTGKLSFPTGNPGMVILAHLNQPAPNVCALRPELPATFGAAVGRALAKDPAERFDSAGVFVAALHANPL
ncbi:MAG: hypothetical protein OHK0052_24030 [Anaerolineales bacterium]